MYGGLADVFNFIILIIDVKHFHTLESYTCIDTAIISLEVASFSLKSLHKLKQNITKP